MRVKLQRRVRSSKDPDAHPMIITSRHENINSGEGLGDYTNRMLESVGITKDKYKAAKKSIGLPPTCHCAEVQAWLNKASDWWKSTR